MKKLFILIFLGVVFFIGGQWIGLEVQSHRLQEVDSPAAGGDASAKASGRTSEVNSSDLEVPVLKK